MTTKKKTTQIITAVPRNVFYSTDWWSATLILQANWIVMWECTAKFTEWEKEMLKSIMQTTAQRKNEELNKITK